MQLLFFIAPVANIFFNNNAVEGVVKLLSLNFIINSFAFLPEIILAKELNYKKLSLTQIVTGVITPILTVVLALTGFKYWSIVVANVSATAVSVIFINILKPIKIRFIFERKIALEFLYFGGGLFLTGIIGFVIFNFDNFIIGALKGSEILGYYAIAFTWGSMVCTISGSIINSVLFPTFSKMQGDRKKLKKAYLEIMEYTTFIVVFGNLTLFVISKEFLYIILGKNTDKWLPAIATFRILCVFGISRALLEPIGSFILAIGKINLLLRSNLIVGAIELSIVYPALKYFGIEGVAIAVTAVYSLQYLIYFYFFRRELDIGLIDLFKSVKSVIIPALVILVGFIVFSYICNECSLLLLFIKTFLTGVGFFIIHGYITNWKLIKESKSAIVNWRSPVKYLQE